VTGVAVIAHSGKTVDGGLPELRRVLARYGVSDPLWVEVPKSRKAPKQVRRLLDQGAEHFIVWGGDGMAQRSIDTLAGTGRTMAIIPAGTANLLASNLGIPKDIEGAVATALDGAERAIDVASMNGERFAVMAGAGFDARMIEEHGRARVQRHHPGRGRAVVRRPGKLHPGRERGGALRRRGGVRGRDARRRAAGHRRHHRRRRPRVDANRDADGCG
jgi:diacylglycerol kinase (ATP)